MHRTLFASPSLSFARGLVSWLQRGGMEPARWALEGLADAVVELVKEPPELAEIMRGGVPSTSLQGVLLRLLPFNKKAGTAESRSSNAPLRKVFVSHVSQRSFTDPYGNDWTVTSEEDAGTTTRVQTVIDPNGMVLANQAQVRQPLTMLSEEEFNRFSDASIWYMADEKPSADKLSRMAEAAPEWLEDLAADEIVTKSEANGCATDLRTPLLVAVQANSAAAVKSLLKCSADPLWPSSQAPPLKPYEVALADMQLGVLQPMVENLGPTRLPLNRLEECRNIIAQREGEPLGIPRDERDHLRKLKKTLNRRITELRRQLTSPRKQKKKLP
jgi:hypothetical protein